MGKEEVCNMDCLNCIHPDCINESISQSRQVKYYWRNREKVLAYKKEAYRRKKLEVKK